MDRRGIPYVFTVQYRYRYCMYSTVRWADLHKISSTGKKVETSGIFDNIRGETGENIIKSNSRNTPILDL